MFQLAFEVHNPGRTREEFVIRAEPGTTKHLKEALKLSPHLAGFTVGCRTLGRLGALDLTKAGGRFVVPPAKGFGTAIGFVELGHKLPDL